MRFFLIAALVCVSAFGQADKRTNLTIHGTDFIPPNQSSAPSGACSPNNKVVIVTGTTPPEQWLCKAGTWTKLVAGPNTVIDVLADSEAIGTRGALDLIPGPGMTYSGTDTGDTVEITGGPDTAVVLTKAASQAGAQMLCVSSTGTDTYECDMTPPLTAYATGMVVQFKATGTASSGAASLCINNIGGCASPPAILKHDGSALDTASVPLSQQVALWYDGTAFRLPAGASSSSSGSTTACVNTQSGTTYTIQASDIGCVVEFTNSSAVTVTLPSGLGAGFNVVLVQTGTGQVTVSASGTTINAWNSALKTAGQYGHAALIALQADTFWMTGNTLP
jgi:hypothetical protein